MRYLGGMVRLATTTVQQKDGGLFGYEAIAKSAMLSGDFHRESSPEAEPKIRRAAGNSVPLEA